MATNRQPPVPDALATPKIQAAMWRIDWLIALVREPVTLTTERPIPNEPHNWDLVAPTMLYSAF